MHLSGSKVIVILFITTANSCAWEVLKGEQHSSNKSSSYEFSMLSDFLDYNLVSRVIIIYTSSTSTWKTNTTPGWRNIVYKKALLQLSLLRKLTQNYRIQFVNSLWHNSLEYFIPSLTFKFAVFMEYEAGDKGKEMILNYLSKRGKFNKSLKCLLLMKGSSRNPLIDIQEAFSSLNISLDADVTVAVPRGKSTFDLNDIYKICHNCGSPLQVEYKGNWTFKSGFAILNKFHYGIAVRRNNWERLRVRAATVILNKSPALKMTDLQYLNNDKDFMEADAMQRKTYQLLQLMENLYNMTFNVTFTNNWGEEVNGTWTGVLGLLHYRQVELSLCPLRYLSERIKAADFSRNIHTEKIHFIFRHPRRSTRIRNIFFEPLTAIVWWCVILLIIIAILLLAVQVHAECKIFTELQKPTVIDGKRNVKVFQLAVENTFDFVVLCIMQAVLMQGPAPELFRCNSTRLLVVSTSVFAILLMQFYGAFIVSSLLSEAPRTITNLQALYDSSLEIGMENISYNYDVFINNKNPLARNLYKYRICNKHNRQPNVMTLEKGAKNVAKGNFAFHVAIDRVYRLLTPLLTESEFCDLQEINFHPSFVFSSGIGIRKSIPFYEFITFAIAVFQESGLLNYNNKKWALNKIDCVAVQGEEVVVDLEHFAPALALLFFSILISLMTLTIEIVYEKISTRMHLKSGFWGKN